MKHLYLILIAFVWLSCNQASAPSNHEPINDLQLEYEQFTLENGLEVILHVDRSDPIVAMSTVVHVGSNREKPGRTGFAHFFEHMSFNDSENVPRGWNRKAIPEWGGTRNGGTWSDGTIYYEQVPKDAFDKLLWIDSDRLGYMINTVTEDALEREKQVVKNEKRQRVDNSPYGYTDEIIRKNLYPEGHPYSWTVIGSLPDLQAATLEDVKEFYHQFYGPNNATLAIVGDIDVEETKEKVKNWFGEIKRGPTVEKPKPMPVTLTETKRLYFEDNFAKLPELRIVFPTVEQQHKDEIPLQILGSLLSGSKTAPLYVSVVEQNKLAPNVSAYSYSQEIAGEFIIRSRGNATTDLDDLKAAIENGFDLFEQNGVNETDLQRIKAETETAMYFENESILGKANSIAINNEFAGDPAYSVKKIKEILAVTADDIMRVYNTYIKNKNYVMTSVIPKGSTELAVQNSREAEVWIEEVKQDVASEEVGEGVVADYEKTATIWDRSEPEFGSLPLFQSPDIWESTSNGIDIMGIENREVPLISFSITIDGGSWLDPIDKKGVSYLLSDLMMEGTLNKTSAELEEAIGLLGSFININSNSESFTISGTTLSRNFDETIQLVEEIILQPRWDEEEFNRLKSSLLTSLKGREANPSAIASFVFNRLLYGESHPFGTPTVGTIQTVESITIEDLKTYYNQLSPKIASIQISGDVTKSDAIQTFKKLTEKWDGSGIQMPEYDSSPQTTTSKVYFVDVPNSKQSVLYIGKLALNASNQDADKLSFVNEKLGGGSAGNLFQTLRIGKGYTYGAYSNISTRKEIAPFLIRTSVRTNATQPSLEIIQNMVQNYSNDFTEEDVQMTQQKVLKQASGDYEEMDAKLRLLQTISKFDFSKHYLEDRQQTLLSMTLKDFKEISSTYLNEDEMIYVVVGDKATQWDLVSEFANGRIVELDIYGNQK